MFSVLWTDEIDGYYKNGQVTENKLYFLTRILKIFRYCMPMALDDISVIEFFPKIVNS